MRGEWGQKMLKEHFYVSQTFPSSFITKTNGKPSTIKLVWKWVQKMLKIWWKWKFHIFLTPFQKISKKTELSSKLNVWRWILLPSLPCFMFILCEKLTCVYTVLASEIAIQNQKKNYIIIPHSHLRFCKRQIFMFFLQYQILSGLSTCFVSVRDTQWLCEYDRLWYRFSKSFC